MNLRLLRYFVAVVDEGSFNRAATRLHIAQPPLSRAIQQLEAHVGARLIDRASRPLRLTDIGRLLYAQALQLLARMADVETMVKTAASSQSRRLVIGFVASTIYARLPDLIREFRKAAKNVELVMVESTTLEQIAALKDGRIDIGFGRIRFEDPAVRRVILRHERLIAAFPVDHPLALGDGAISPTNPRSSTPARPAPAMLTRSYLCSATKRSSPPSSMRLVNFRLPSFLLRPKKEWRSFQNLSGAREAMMWTSANWPSKQHLPSS
jgi:DNA-binding transcriptional LysR family regulator